MKENNVEIVLRSDKDEGVEYLRIESKLHCNHFLEVWHFC
jgi:hypothetical protein